MARILRYLALVSVFLLVAAACTTSGDDAGGAAQVDAVEEAKAVTVEEIGRSAGDVPDPIGDRGPETVAFTLETKELVAEVEEGVTYEYWTFGDRVPGPFLRVREGDTVEITIDNPEGSKHLHSIDLHAVIGPGGGKIHTDTPPGEQRTFSFQAMRPGLYVYHCASEHIPTHIANGMYGLILVEPEGGLDPVDREYYVMQGDIYTSGAKGTEGHHGLDQGKMKAEDAEYVVFNGRPGSLTGDRAPTANTGETVRLFVGNGGPNLVSSFHAIGEIFDRLFPEGDIVSAPHASVQTTLIPAGGAAMVEFEVLVPGTYLLVDHSISRAVDKGALAELVVEGDERPDIFANLNEEG